MSVRNPVWLSVGLLIGLAVCGGEGCRKREGVDGKGHGREQKRTTTGEDVAAMKLRLRDVELRLQDIAAGDQEAQERMGKLRDGLEGMPPDIAILEKEFTERRAVLTKKLAALPGMAIRQKRVDELKLEMDKLWEERQSLVGRADGAGDKQALLKDLDAKGAAMAEERGRLNSELGAIKQHARESDPELKSLTAELIERQHLIAARKNQAPAIVDLRKKQEALRKEAAALCAERDALAAGIEKLDPAAKPAAAGAPGKGG